ncbi:efflux pump [Acephala macrosclerotiorum]|nr:efflux pump [Acephala macrosclerotiorum]
MSKPEQQYVTGLKLQVVVGSVTFVLFLMVLDMSIIVTAIPRITSDFHSLPDMGWYGSAYLLSSCALQPLAGRLYTHLGSKSLFLSFLALFEVGSVLCGAAQSSKMLIVGRVVAGMGGSGLTNGALTIISAAAPMHKQPLLVGIMFGISQIGIICGPLIGGAFTEYVNWRWCFYVNLPIGAVAAVLLLMIHIPDRLSHNGSDKLTLQMLLSNLDLTGFALFASFAIMIELGLEWGGQGVPWKSARIIGLLCGGIVALALFAVWEYRVGENAMIPPSVAGRREVWTSCLYLGFFSGALLCFTYYLPTYFQAVKGVSPLISGVYMLSGIVPQLIMAIVSGLFIGKTGYYLPWALAGAVIACAAAGLVSTFTVHESTAKWVMYQFIGGFGRGCGLQAVSIITSITPSHTPEQNSLGMSLAAFGQTFGGSLALSIADILFEDGLVSGLESYAPSIDPSIIVKAGSTGFRQVVNSDQLPGVLQAYTGAIDKTFYLAAAFSGVTFVLAWGMGWHKLRKEAKDAPVQPLVDNLP